MTKEERVEKAKKIFETRILTDEDFKKIESYQRKRETEFFKKGGKRNHAEAFPEEEDRLDDGDDDDCCDGDDDDDYCYISSDDDFFFKINLRIFFYTEVNSWSCRTLKTFTRKESTTRKRDWRRLW